MIQPVLKDDAFLEDVGRARKASNDYHIWWLGQSGFLLKWQDRHLIIDPYLSDALADKHRTDPARPHLRLSEPVVDPLQLDFIDVALATHNHGDHLDRDTLRDIWTVSPAMRLVVPEANREYVADYLGVHAALPIGLDDGETVTYADFSLTGIAAAHEELAQDEDDHYENLGYVIEFGDGFTVYHSGDTVMYEGLVERLDKFDIDVALLPISGRKPERGVKGTLNGKEAANLAKQIDVGVVIPCHYNMFAFNTASPDEFVAEAEAIEQPFKVLTVGERWSNQA